MFEIIESDSLEWFAKQKNNTINNVLTGLPDMDEMNMTDMDDYLSFIEKMTGLIFDKLKSHGYAIFIQTDRKINGQWIDKSFYITKNAMEKGMKLIWHKIVLQRDVGQTNLHRPTYSHVLCYTRTGKPGAAFPDVFPVSTKLYANATPENVSTRCVEYINSVNKVRAKEDEECPYDIVDPFVGRGTTGRSTLNNKLSFLGIDIDGKQCLESRKFLSSIDSVTETPVVIGKNKIKIEIKLKNVLN